MREWHMGLKKTGQPYGCPARFCQFHRLRHFSLWSSHRKIWHLFDLYNSKRLIKAWLKLWESDTWGSKRRDNPTVVPPDFVNFTDWDTLVFEVLIEKFDIYLTCITARDWLKHGWSYERVTHGAQKDGTTLRLSRLNASISHSLLNSHAKIWHLLSCTTTREWLEHFQSFVWVTHGGHKKGKTFRLSRQNAAISQSKTI